MGAPPTPLTPGQPGPAAPGEFKSLSIPQIVSFQLANVTPPSFVYIMRDDVLLVEVISAFANITVTLNARLLLAARGEVIPITALLATGVAGTSSFFLIPLAEGYLLSLSIFGPGQSGTPGSTFVRAGIGRGGTTTAFVSTLLVASYCTPRHPASWPGGQIRQAAEGPGRINSLTIAQPGAGADIVVNVPTARRWRVLSLRAALTTSGVAGNRNVRMQLTDGTNVIYAVQDTLAQISGQTTFYTFSSAGVLQQVAAFEQNLPLPPLMMLAAGYQITSATAGILAGDQWSVPFAVVEEWIDN